MYYMIQYYPEIETCTQEKEGDRVEKEKEIQSAIDEDFGDTKLGRLRYFLVNKEIFSRFVWAYQLLSHSKFMIIAF